MIHLIKLCVGISSVQQLIDWRVERDQLGLGRPDGMTVHRTRMMPKRRDEIMGQGSLYWVINGAIRARQRIADLEVTQDDEGKSMCNIIMHPKLIWTVPQPRRPFQGWRYFLVDDSPADLPDDVLDDDMAMAEELAKLGLI